MDKQIRISQELHKKIKDCAKKEKRTLKAILELAVKEYSKK